MTLVRKKATIFLGLGLLLAISAITFGYTSVAGQSSQSPQNKTFYSIYIGGPPDFKTNVTKNALNGSESQMEEQLKTLIHDEYKELNKTKSEGPVILLGKTPGETIVKESIPENEFLDYYRGLIKQPIEGETEAAACWLWLLGGGSMHGDCPKQN
jgi:hypothetical protein